MKAIVLGPRKHICKADEGNFYPSLLENNILLNYVYRFIRSSTNILRSAGIE